MRNPVNDPPRLLVVDDRPAQRGRLFHWLEAEGYDCVRADGPAEVRVQLGTPGLGVVVLEVETAARYAAELARLLDEHSPATSLLAMAREGISPDVIRRAARGAYAFLSEPLGREDLVAGVREGLGQRRLCQEVSRLIGRYSRRERSRTRMFARLTRATRLRDEETGGHVARSGAESARLAARSGWAAGDVERIRLAAPLHDIGKIGIPDRILLKPGKLTQEETFAMQAHTILGARMLAGSADPALRLAREIALFHHERWDGGGYPLGLAGHAIPESARIVAIVDVFDALTHDRIYRPALPEADVLALMREGRGTHFDPRLLDLFVARGSSTRTLAP